MAFSPNTIVTDPNILNCSFTIPSSTVTAPAVYSTNNAYYLVTASISSSTTLVAAGPSAPPATGTLTLVTGTGPATIAYTAVSSSANIPETAYVKLPGAAPTAADMAMVVGLSPNGNQATSALQSSAITVLNTIATNTGASTDITAIGTITALNGAVSVNAQGAHTISASITGTFVATLVARGQLADNTWVVLPMYVVSGSVPYSVEFSTTTPQTVLITGGGYLNIEIYSTAYTSGTVNVALDASLAQQITFSAQLGTWIATVTQATAANLNAQVVGNVAAGSAISGNPVQVGGSDGTNVRELPIQAKNTQSTYAVSVQNQYDTGRNITNFFMANQVITTATDTLVSLTGYKGGAAVSATTTPAVVTSGKTYRVTSIAITYVAITTAGTARFSLRANTSGTVVIGSPVAQEWIIGGSSTTAGVSQTVSIPIPEGMEFAAGTGIGVSMQGFGATGTAAAVGYGQITISGYEY